jgi:putative lipoprotein
MAEAPIGLAPGATLIVRLLDVTRTESDATLVAEQTFNVAGLPAEFVLPYDKAAVNSIRSYAIDASVMEQGAVRFITASKVGALTQGKSNRVTVMMMQAMQAAAPKDPVAELNKEFADFEARLGGLKRVVGERISGPEGQEVAIGWDAFLDESGVRMVREMVSYPDGGRVNVRYAFKDGKPWVMVRESGGAKTRIGWDAEGAVILSERNGQPAEVDEADAKAARREAREARSLVSAQAGGGT